MSLPAVEELKAHLEQQLPGVSLSIEGETVIVSPKDLTSVCRYLKDTPQYGLDYLSNLTAVDYPPERIDLIVHLYSIQHRHGPVTLSVHVDRANPRVDSLTPIWRGAEYQEREVYDLFGIVFQGHPDLRRILMWDEFEGHPMRKDYVDEDQDAPIVLCTSRRCSPFQEVLYCGRVASASRDQAGTLVGAVAFGGSPGHHRVFVDCGSEGV